MNNKCFKVTTTNSTALYGTVNLNARLNIPLPNNNIAYPGNNAVSWATPGTRPCEIPTDIKDLFKRKF